MSEAEPRQLPDHVGIIMDGNGRWASTRGLPRSEGHRIGLEVAKSIVQAASRMGMKYLSLYVFSTENWKRTIDEVGFLMGLINKHLRSELKFYRDNNIRIVHSGDPAGLPAEVLAQIREVESETSGFQGLTLNLAINYGGRDELVRAMRRIAARYGSLPAVIDEEAISQALDRPDLPDPDLIIRTAGEYRLSNFLVWEAAYSELWFSEKLWPDFKPADFESALDEYLRRERRFGGNG
ncbi:MAG: polyprenyl diphosphate synthase [Rectinemataceae bacterium]